MSRLLWIGLAGAVGTLVRYFTGLVAGRAFGTGFPFGTLAINVTGSFVIGFFLVLTAERVVADPRWRFLIAIGFCGGYTTFSSYAYETWVLLEQGRWLASVSNIVLSNLLCLLGVIGGAALARSF